MNGNGENEKREKRLKEKRRDLNTRDVSYPRT